jgi:hypothetical protein
MKYIIGKLSFQNAFSFPLQSKQSRRDIMIGGLILLIPIWGWIANLGHRVVYTHKMIHGNLPFPSWNNYGTITRHGFITLIGMIYYHLPATLVEVIARYMDIKGLHYVAIVLWLVGTVLVPGYMTSYCRDYNYKSIFNPMTCIRNISNCGSSFWHAWLVVMVAMLISLLGLLAFGIGFLFSSVWFWQVAAFSFTSVFVANFDTDQNENI